MSRYMIGSGKLVPSISEYSSSKQPAKEKVADPVIQDDVPEPTVDIPEVPENPDHRPKLIQFAEEYFGKYWVAVLVVILFLLFRKIK